MSSNLIKFDFKVKMQPDDKDQDAEEAADEDAPLEAADHAPAGGGGAPWRLLQARRGAVVGARQKFLARTSLKCMI